MVRAAARAAAASASRDEHLDVLEMVRVDDLLEEVEGLEHAVLARVLREHLVVFGEGRDEHDDVNLRQSGPVVYVNLGEPRRDAE